MLIKKIENESDIHKADYTVSIIHESRGKGRGYCRGKLVNLVLELEMEIM